MFSKTDEIQNYKQRSRSMVYHHRLCVEHYTKINNILTVITISFVSAIGVSNNITSLSSSTYNVYVNIVYSLLLYVVAVLSAVQKFYNYPEKIETHKTSVIRYSNLLDSINDYINNVHDTEQFYKLIVEEYRSLNSISPVIPTWIMKIQVDEDVMMSTTSVQSLEKEESVKSFESVDKMIEYELNRFKLNSYKDTSVNS